MIRVCFSIHHVGNRVFGEKEPLDDRSETHGLCPDCLPKDLADFNRIDDIKKEGKGEDQPT